MFAFGRVGERPIPAEGTSHRKRIVCSRGLQRAAHGVCVCARTHACVHCGHKVKKGWRQVKVTEVFLCLTMGLNFPESNTGH